MSGYADERQAIEARMATQWAAGPYPTIPVRYENVPFKETDTAYLALFIRRGDGNQISLGPGTQLHRWVGLVVCQIFVPQDTGTNQAATYAQTIAAIFNRQEFSAGASGLIRCRVASVAEVGVRDGWYQMNVTIPYIRDKQV